MESDDKFLSTVSDSEYVINTSQVMGGFGCKMSYSSSAMKMLTLWSYTYIYGCATDLHICFFKGNCHKV